MTRAECSILHPRAPHSVPDRLRVGPRDPLMGLLILTEKADYMKRSIFILGTFCPVFAAITNVQVAGTTHTQAIFKLHGVFRLRLYRGSQQERYFYPIGERYQFDSISQL